MSRVRDLLSARQRGFWILSLQIGLDRVRLVNPPELAQSLLFDGELLGP